MYSWYPGGGFALLTASGMRHQQNVSFSYICPGIPRSPFLQPSFLQPGSEVPFTAFMGHSFPCKKRSAVWPGFTQAVSQSTAGESKYLTYSLKPKVKGTHLSRVHGIPTLGPGSAWGSTGGPGALEDRMASPGHNREVQAKSPGRGQGPPRTSLSKVACEQA